MFKWMLAMVGLSLGKGSLSELLVGVVAPQIIHD
jgi:hypothetical protein